ncbi:hypothetical protein [Mesorhizobium sp. SP-1A]|uniref:hypothetical protein n=1 Tax=Mesorhizobium sp. SP-1A TaxID=3077840 RepID=UPI0028F7162E|nr:hypothetical protein [Mesorhizobium sp. SP-1A]
MNSEKRFAKALFEGFRSPEVRKRIEQFNSPSYTIGDGTPVVLGDQLRIPEAVGGRRAKEWGEVVQLSDEGLGIRFEEKIAGITREFFEWDELTGAAVVAVPRKGKRASIVPPVTHEKGANRLPSL